MKQRFCHGFTLAEVVLGGTVLAIAVAAILGAYVGQVTLNEHARNLSLAIQDANRVIEQIRQQTVGCGTTPDASAPGGAGWDTWLTNNGGKSIQPNPANNELVVVTCQASGGGVAVPACTGPNPIRVTAAVCWRHRGRIIGECATNGVALQAQQDAGNGPKNDPDVIESSAMLTTLVTCR